MSRYSTRATQDRNARASPGEPPLHGGTPLQGAPTARGPRRALTAAALLGFALGGFFDGILLHQVLQWHHLLSALDGPFASLRAQVVADGAFHLLMYVLALAGAWLLLRSRGELAAVPARRLVGAALAGFGTWHVVDGVVSHWLLGIHRIRMGVPDPLFWDLLWFFAFGVVVLAAGAWLLRRGGAASRARPAAVTAVSLVMLAATSGPIAAMPPRGAPALVLFASDVPPERVHDAIVAAGAGLLSFDARTNLWVLDLPDPDRTEALHRAGAIVVARSPMLIGCLASSRG